MRHYSYDIGDFTTALNKCEASLRNQADERARWFAAQLRVMLKLAGEIYHSSPSADTWVKIREFQLQEIRGDLARARAKIVDLEAAELALMPKLEAALNARIERQIEEAETLDER